MKKWIVKACFLGFSFFGIGYLTYLLLKSDKSDISNTDDDDDMLDFSRAPTIPVKSISREIIVPTRIVGLLVGQGGHRIKKTERNTCTKIYFRERRNLPGQRLCLIRGTPEAVDSALQILYNSIVNLASMQTVEIFVPLRVCSSLALSYGDQLRRVERLTHTRLVLDHWCFHNNYSTRKIYIRGKTDEIARVKDYIAQKLEEDEPPQMTPGSTLPAPIRNRVGPDSDDSESDDESEVDIDTIYNSGNNKLLEVYVTAVINPSKFWIQIMGPNILELDKLVEEMTASYDNPEFQRTQELEEVEVGKIIAAPCTEDRKWYRGEILACTTDEEDEMNPMIRVQYVDFGDIVEFKSKECYDLSEEFLELRFQAIECELANVKPRTEWNSEATQLFCELTTDGIWKTMSAMILDYRVRSTTHYKKSLPSFCVQLVDTTAPNYVDPAVVLVDKGYAEWNVTVED